MLTSARQILLSEMVLAGEMDVARADVLIDEAV